MPGSSGNPKAAEATGTMIGNRTTVQQHIQQVEIDELSCCSSNVSACARSVLRCSRVSADISARSASTVL
jgi:hypothetical protein